MNIKKEKEFALNNKSLNLIVRLSILFIFMAIVGTVAFAGNQSDVLGLSNVYETLSEWTSDRNLNLVVTTAVVVVGLVRWWQVGGMAGGVQFGALFLLALIFYNSNKIVEAIYSGVF